MNGIFGNAAAERKALEDTYEDTLDVLRPEDTKDGSITRTALATVSEGSICALSHPGGGGNQTDTFNLLDYDGKVFAPPEVDVRPGDVLHVTRFGRVDKAAQTVFVFEPVGQPAPYPTHQEIMVKVRDKA